MRFINVLHWFSIVMIPVSIGVIAYGIITDQATTGSLVTMGFNLVAFTVLAFLVTPMMKETQLITDEINESLAKMNDEFDKMDRGSKYWYGD